jgi:UDP-N-acetylmuramoyl-tripeptide--D-alanyl-D-alanine ligase
LTVERPRAGKPRETLRVDLPLVGEVAALDFCGALAAAEAMVGEALDVALVQSGVSRVRPVGGRGETITLADGTLVIDDSYNANPGSMRAALRTLAELGASAKRTVAVLGEMKELGTGSEEEHEALGDELAAQHVSVVIGCGGLIDLALTRAKKLGLEVHHAVSAAEAATVAELIARPGDVILVKGSRSVGAEVVVRALELMHGKKEAP